MIGVLPTVYLRCMPGAPILLKGAGRFADILGWSPDILCTRHPSPRFQTHHPSLEFFEAGLRDLIRDIYQVRVQRTFRSIKILTHKQT